MRVITGTARGRRLKELEGMETRPTTDRVKEGLFSALQFDIEGRKVLDLFAGTGQLGIECLSRGAVSAVFVDRRADAVKLIRENLKVTELTDRAKVISGDSMEYLKSLREKFDLIFLDPPYASGNLERALERITAIDIVSGNGIIVCESPVELTLPEVPGTYEKTGEYRYGKIKATLYRSIVTKLAALMIKKPMKAMKKELDPSELGGAPILGISKPVVKAHGSSDAKAFKNAIRQVIGYAESGAIEQLTVCAAELGEKKKAKREADKSLPIA